MTEVQAAPDEDREEINRTIIGIHTTLKHNQVRLDVGASALMVLAAEYACQSLETDDYIIQAFKTCVAQARAQGMTKQ